jgi:hypothetical protein
MLPAAARTAAVLQVQTQQCLAAAIASHLLYLASAIMDLTCSSRVVLAMLAKGYRVPGQIKEAQWTMQLQTR